MLDNYGNVGKKFVQLSLLYSSTKELWTYYFIWHIWNWFLLLLKLIKYVQKCEASYLRRLFSLVSCQSGLTWSMSKSKQARTLKFGNKCKWNLNGLNLIIYVSYLHLSPPILLGLIFGYTAQLCVWKPDFLLLQDFGCVHTTKKKDRKLGCRYMDTSMHTHLEDACYMHIRNDIT